MSWVPRTNDIDTLFRNAPSVASLPSGRPSERKECLRSSKYESAIFKFKFPLKLLLRDIVAPPFKGLTVNRAVAVLLLSNLSLKFNSFIDIAEGERCIDKDTGMLVIPSLPSKFEAVVVIVGSCAVEIGKIFKVAEVSVELVVTVKGKDSVVILEVTGIAEKKKQK